MEVVCLVVSVTLHFVQQAIICALTLNNGFKSRSDSTLTHPEA
jgi:hypothetical protein